MSFERLVFPEVRNRESQRIDGDQFIGNLGLEHEEEIRCIEVALELAMVGRRVVDHVEVHARAERRGLQLFERKPSSRHVDLWGGGVREEFPDDIGLAIFIQNAICELAIEEVQRLREIVLNGVAIPAIEERAKLAQEVFASASWGLYSKL